MHRAKLTCAHGHPWYRLDCVGCEYEEFHDLLRRRPAHPDPVLDLLRKDMRAGLARLSAEQLASLTR